MRAADEGCFDVFMVAFHLMRKLPGGLFFR